MKLIYYASSLFTTLSFFSTVRQATMQNFAGNSDSVSLIFVVFRHGQRAPVLFSASDPNKYIWPNGPGSLTNAGKLQAHEVGVTLRHKYGHLISETYRKDEIYVRSTDVDRCLMTAQCSLAGLYPPKKNDFWMEGFNWQPVPVHTSLKAFDPLNVKFIRNFVPPPGGYPTERQRQAYRVILENQDTMAALTKEFSDVLDVSLSLQALDTYMVETAAGLPPYLPAGLEMDITKATLIFDNIYDLLCQSTKYIVTASAHLLQDIVTKSANKMNGETPKQKAFLYSLHDISVSGCLAAFTDKFVRPDYTATLIFELHKHPETEDYFIKILYRNSPAEHFEEIPINGSPLTPFSEFQRIIDDFVNSSKMWTETD